GLNFNVNSRSMSQKQGTASNDDASAAGIEISPEKRSNSRVDTTNPPSESKDRMTILQLISLKIVGSLERFFYRWGYQIGLTPVPFIVACVILTVLCGIGLLRFTPENRPDKLWIPWNSEFVKDTEWLNKNFPSPFRFHYAIITAEDVLQPKVLDVLLEIHNKVKEIEASTYKWKDICFKLPVIKFDTNKRRKREVNNANNSATLFNGNFDGFDSAFDFDDDEEATSEKPFDPSVSLPTDVYCNIVSSLDKECFELNMLELWNYNSSVINKLTKEEIVNAINHEQIRQVFYPVFGRPVNYATELGKLQRNESGYIIGAEAVMIRWFARLNRTAMNLGDVLNDEGTGQAVDKYNFMWEKELSKFFLSFRPPEGVNIYFNVARSFADISGSTIMGDASMLAVGFSIVFLYVIFMLGKFNFVEQRPLLSLAGLSCVGLAILVSYGICSAFKIIYGPVHNILPFLLLGIGIDDMFVIMQCWNNLRPEDMKKSIPEKLGLTLQHAGVSITITSLTDFFAFAIGGTTVLPALQSFCVYAALGIVATYIFQATFFVAWLAIDQKRIERRRNAFIPYIIHASFSPKTLMTRSFAQTAIEKIYCKVLFRKFSKVMVFLVTFGVFGVNVWGNILLRQEFNPIWFLPQDSYLFKYFAARDQFFPEKGEEGFILMNDVDLNSNLPKLESLLLDFENSTFVHEIDAWYPPFKQYVNSNFGKDIPNQKLTNKEFNKYLGKFLFSPTGGKYQSRFKFDKNLTCGKSAPAVMLSSANFKFNIFSGPEQHVPAMNNIKRIIREANFTPANSHTFIWSFAFAGWETDEIITDELYRNMGLAMICVFLTTLVLIANLQTCCMVLLCVILTLVDVGGSMHFWNLTIDTVSCIDLVLAIGLCVDYAAHIAHAFMTSVGTRNERSTKALVNIGPAVLNGGFSTFLAFILLANSKSHVFLTFFKIFFLVVVYGLFHGLVFLPVLLSIIGPAPYATAVLEDENNDKRETRELQVLLLVNQNNEPLGKPCCNGNTEGENVLLRNGKGDFD
ncbi:Patched domain-containing protein 3, partial [Orchesella cincta]